jgi:hypothetical protein
MEIGQYAEFILYICAASIYCPTLSTTRCASSTTIATGSELSGAAFIGIASPFPPLSHTFVVVVKHYASPERLRPAEPTRFRERVGLSRFLLRCADDRHSFLQLGMDRMQGRELLARNFSLCLHVCDVSVFSKCRLQVVPRGIYCSHSQVRGRKSSH